MTLVSKTLAPNGALVDPTNGRATPPFNNYLNSLSILANTAAGGSIVTAPGSGLTGGGDTSSTLSLSIAPNGVTDAMIRQSAAYSVIGRQFGTPGNVADITADADNRVLARIGGVLAFYDLAVVPATVADGDYGDITVSGTGTIWTIDPNVVTNAKFRQSTGLSVVGRSASTTGNVADITGAASQFLGVNAGATALVFQTMAGDATLSGATLTLATVNASIGTWGSATQAPVIILDGKGRATAASNITITPAAASITAGQALTQANDTNVTLTLGGTPATALLKAVSITAGWTGRLAYGRFIAATQKCLLGATAAGDFGEITLGTGVAITAGVLSATGTGGTVTSVSLSAPLGGGTVTTTGTLGTTTFTNHGVILGQGASALVATAAGGANTFLAGVAGADPTFRAVNVGTADVTGTLPVARGGTNQTSLGDITRTSDTNVTLTLGGTPAGSVVTSVSFTLGWTGTLAVSRGGTGGGTASGTLLDNITGFASTGILARTAAGTYAFRTITGTANQIAVTNGDGVAGAPTIALATSISGAWTAWVPVVTAGTGTITTYTTGTCAFLRIGKGIWYYGLVTITVAGTGSGPALITLPSTVLARDVGYGRENALTGIMLQTLTTASSNQLSVRDYAGGGVVATGAAIYFSGFYEEV